MADLKRWCYPAKQYRRWHYYSIRRALRWLGAVQLGRATGRGKPAIYRLAP